MTPPYVRDVVGARRQDGDVATVISWREACGRRMRRHGLLDPLPSVPAAAAATCGAHAQVMSAAEVSLGLRVHGITRADVVAALWTDRSVVKTFGPRGTVHLLPAADLSWWLAALEALPRAQLAVGVRLDAAQTEDVVGAVGAALTGAELVVEELDDAIAAACGSWAVEPVMPAFGGYWPRWRQAVGTAAVRGELCFGPPRGRRVTYTHPRRWVPGLTQADGAGSLARLVREFLRAYGPARPEHLAQWLAVPTTVVTPLFAAADLDEVALDGQRAWVVAGDTAFDDEPAPLRLLPYFDALAVGSHPRASLYPGRAGERALAGSQAGNFPVVVIDGIVGGVWHQKRSGRKVAITVEPLRPLTAAQRRLLAAEVERIAEIVEATAQLTIGTVTVGAHA